MMRTVAILSILAALALPAGSEAQPAGAFGEAIDVRVVNVEAVVTGRGGERVKGLTAEDFRLLVDGREVPIEFFTEIADGTVAPAPGEQAAPAPVAVAGQEAIGRSILVFIDDSFSLAPQRNAVLLKIEQSLGRLAPADRVGVVAFDGKKLDLLTDWTGDPERIAAVLAEARKRKAHGQLLAARRQELNRQLAGLHSVQGFTPLPVPTTASVFFERPGLAPQDGTPDVSSLVAAGGPPIDLETPLIRVVAAAAASLRGLPAPGGRKVMLVLSGGWPLLEPPALGRVTEQSRDWLWNGSTDAIYRPLVDTANLLGYTLYPVDVPGLDSASTGADASAAEFTNYSGLISSEWDRATGYALEYLARETGGKAAVNAARMEAFDRLADDTGSYYWLGFTPAWKADDRRHRIRLEARRPGLAVRTRSGFRDLSRQTEMAMSTEGLLVLGVDAGLQQKGRVMEVEMGKPQRDGLSGYRVPVVLILPADALTRVPVSGGFAVDAILSLGALDRWGATSDLPQVPLRLTLPREPRPGDRLRYHTTLRMRGGKQRVVFTVRDSLSGEILWASLDYKP